MKHSEEIKNFPKEVEKYLQELEDIITGKQIKKEYLLEVYWKNLVEPGGRIKWEKWKNIKIID